MEYSEAICQWRSLWYARDVCHSARGHDQGVCFMSSCYAQIFGIFFSRLFSNPLGEEIEPSPQASLLYFWKFSDPAQYNMDT